MPEYLKWRLLIPSTIETKDEENPHSNKAPYINSETPVCLDFRQDFLVYDCTLSYVYG